MMTSGTAYSAASMLGGRRAGQARGPRHRRGLGAERGSQRGVIVAGQRVEVLVHDAHGQRAARRVRTERLQLDQQALAQAGGAVARRVEPLQVVQHGEDARTGGRHLGLHRQRHFLERRLEVAGVGDMVHQDLADAQVGGVRERELELGQDAQARIAHLRRGAPRLEAFLVLERRGAAEDLHGAVPLGGRVAVGGRRLGGRRGFLGFLALEHHVVLEGLSHLLLELQRGQVQQADGLQELRRQMEGLAHLQLQCRLHPGLPLVVASGANPRVGEPARQSVRA
jgi:hypothetical protein